MDWSNGHVDAALVDLTYTASANYHHHLIDDIVEGRKI